MMTSWNGNIFCVTGPLWGGYTYIVMLRQGTCDRANHAPFHWIPPFIEITPMVFIDCLLHYRFEIKKTALVHGCDIFMEHAISWCRVNQEQGSCATNVTQINRTILWHAEILNISQDIWCILRVLTQHRILLLSLLLHLFLQTILYRSRHIWYLARQCVYRHSSYPG